MSTIVLPIALTKQRTYATRNYDLVINMDGKTEEEAVDLILKYIG